MDFRDYAVINCSVEIAKKLKIYHGFINACLKKISKNKERLRKTRIQFNDLPNWFKKETKLLPSLEKKRFVKNFNKEPDIHLVFKDKTVLKNVEGKTVDQMLKALQKESINENRRLYVETIAGLKKKAEKSGMPYSILKKVYDRGMAAWKGGHRPGASQQQWAFARVNSFVTKSSGTWGGADKDLAKQVRGSK